MKYYNYQDMAAVLLRERGRLPERVDLVVGIPRSGMAAATMIATQLNIPMTDPDGFRAGRLMAVGETKSRPDIARALSDDRTVLLVDDVIGSGRAFRQAQEVLAGAAHPGRIVSCAVFGPDLSHPDVDLVLEEAPIGFLSQWNLMHHAILADTGVALEGVLSPQPALHEIADPDAFARFLEMNGPLHATSGKIGEIVSRADEKCRDAVEAWLARHGIRYDRLAHVPHGADQAIFKAQVYRRATTQVFIEASATVARRIAARTGRPVLCLETQSIVFPYMRDNAYAPVEIRRSSAFLSRFKLRTRLIVGKRAYSAMKAIAARRLG
ncbi:phosphoribosyltransferase family protein [Jannaschia aquimarina]|uniref:PyrE_2 protein n=1 Tax=Jannaschia aquimarina TaxID=935700 RepID=A0A0D1D4U6_9RHOB|nr:phosphoribosyltransferase family protein [Jannaschia aquimarina]KIT15093.1 Orotate phosphoribosyltransferase [Jannaschia aquimarina]SNS63889.1 Uncharacterized protein, HAD superfamily [Jannaschia aquimarina]